jgi:hypothetical protein
MQTLECRKEPERRDVFFLVAIGGTAFYLPLSTLQLLRPPHPRLPPSEGGRGYEEELTWRGVVAITGAFGRSKKGRRRRAAALQNWLSGVHIDRPHRMNYKVQKIKYTL